jgi:hypothetical protein
MSYSYFVFFYEEMVAGYQLPLPLNIFGQSHFTNETPDLNYLHFLLA